MSYGQFEVKGTVKDADTGEVLPAANVFLGEKVVPTDGQGRFQFDKVKEGEYVLKVTFIGYDPFEQELDVVSDR